MAKLSRNQARIKKHNRIKAKLALGTAIKPRLSVYKSLSNFYAQLIDDSTGKTLASVSTLKNAEYGGNIKAAEKVGTLMGQKINELKIQSIVFDRSGYIYHGRVKAFAEAVRKEGVKF
ncbi:50S ribosomal protein L18 [Mesomycoplasma lagogenitalium]|uniref:Large ribosomal subunit protein uL18 n=1 Tax=Mesomycoplasma lagogenitalium TaxID=171286 RepID=A0ABY8LTK4_9BACT|nr:50S ribosomal protein L18 [Mesomycoplasma lagogenitalium]WGI36572.1 50S ribosomal protein L18 [Mesomycoplasma lagogenitalium]